MLLCGEIFDILFGIAELVRYVSVLLSESREVVVIVVELSDAKEVVVKVIVVVDPTEVVVEAIVEVGTAEDGSFDPKMKLVKNPLTAFVDVACEGIVVV